jgi:hypothetical protein
MGCRGHKQNQEGQKITKPLALVMQSDRGIQYTCSTYKEATDKFIYSYSTKAYP